MFDSIKPTWAGAYYAMDQLVDTSSVTKTAHTHHIYGSEFDRHISISANNDYPERIKFQSVDYLFQETAQRTTRYSYGLLELFRDVGGLKALLDSVLIFILSFYGNNKIFGIIASRAYNDDRGYTTQAGKNINSFGNFENSCWSLEYFCCLKCCYSTEKQKLTIIEQEIRSNLDVVTLMKRLRVHGQVLKQLMKSESGREKICSE